MLISRGVFVVFIWIWALHSSVTTGWAQGGGDAGVATIAGRVTDSGGGVIVGASVAVTDSARVSRTTVSDARGEFVVTGLPIGTYIVTIDRKQFKRAVVQVKLIAAEPRAELSIVLTPAAFAERVTVSGRDVPYAEPETTTAGKVAVPRREVPNSVSVLTREQMQDQNMVNTWDALSQMTGVTAISNSGTHSQFHARGAALSHNRTVCHRRCRSVVFNNTTWPFTTGWKNLHTQSLRAFSADEMGKIVGKMV